MTGTDGKTTVSNLLATVLQNNGYTVTNNFIDKLKGGDEEAHKRFSRALYVKMVTGKGYFFFIDKANRARPPMYKDLHLDVKASNLC